MRTALISACKRTSEGTLRAHELIAGRALLAWQVDLALQWECERIVCLCDAPTDMIIAQQRIVESKGLAFLTARGPRQLASLFRGDDIVLLQLDGLFVSKDSAGEVLGAGGALEPAILTLAENHPLSASCSEDFERIDRERYWAGLAVIPGGCARYLGEMPGDGDAISLLLRLALQARTTCKSVPDQWFDNDVWFLACDAQARERRGAALIQASLPAPQWAALGQGAATTLVRKTAPHWLGSGPEISAAGSLALAGIGAGLAALGFSAFGLGIVGLGAFAGALALIADTMRSAIAGRNKRALAIAALPFALAGFAYLTLTMANDQSEGWFLRLSLPVLAIGLAWLAGRSADPRSGAFWRDLPMHMLLFAASAALGAVQEALLAFSLGALLTLALRAAKP